MYYLKFVLVTCLLLQATSVLATPNLRSTPITPYGPFLTGQMPIFYFNLLNTGTSDTGTQRPLMNSNWVAVDAYSDNNYPSGKGPHGAWLWISRSPFGPVPAGSSIVVNNGASPTSRWPENDWCVPSGNHRVMLYVDNDNDVPENNNSDNNSVWSSFVVNNRTLPAPDLTAAPAPSAIGPFVQGQPAIIPFRYSNIGTAVPTALLRARALLDLYNDGSANDALTFSGRPVLGIGETRIENFTWPVAVGGTHSIRVNYVDNRFEVDELNDCNNTTNYVTFQVLPVNAEGRLTARTVSGGVTISTTTISYRNIGSMTSPTFSYRVLIGGVQVGTGVTSAPLPVSASWTSAVVPISWTSPVSAATQTLAYTLEITDLTNGIEATASTITVSPNTGPVPRLISCPDTILLGSGATSSLSARYWSNLFSTVPDCTTPGFSDVTNSASWTSSAPANVTVSPSGARGIVMGVTAGNSNITAIYSGLSAITNVTVASVAVPILVAVIPETKFVRSGTVADLRLTVTANVNLTCTLTGAAGSPNIFSHIASTTAINYDQFDTRIMRSTQQLAVSCVNPFDVTQSAASSTVIEVIPIAKEV